MIAPADITTLRPMEAVDALYGDGPADVAAAVVRSMTRRIFETGPPPHTRPIRRFLARPLFRYLGLTVRSEEAVLAGGERVTVFRHRVLERSGHPYAKNLLSPSRADLAGLVEGGDAMNGPYAMLCPEVAANAGFWDKILLDSPMGRDVQIRFANEVRFTCDAARRALAARGRVRIGAVAAGTALAMLVSARHLLDKGVAPDALEVTISDREQTNLDKASRLAEKLPELRDLAGRGALRFEARDLTAADAATTGPEFELVTAVGIFEYFRGIEATTSEALLGEPPHPGSGDEAVAVMRGLGASVVPGGFLVTNSFRAEWGGRLLERFGKRFRYRSRDELQALAAEGGFSATTAFASGAIQDVALFEKTP